MEPKIIVAALYKFVDLETPAVFQAPLQALCKKFAVKGTLLLAPEGINGTIAGPRAGVDGVLAYLRSQPVFSDLEVKESTCARQPFYRPKIRLKKEIVTMNVTGLQPGRKTGVHVAPQDWNALIQDSDTVVIDTRNDYEVEIGSFRGARNPKTDSFSDFPEYVEKTLSKNKDKKIAMFCTGGIRCEKASALLLERGFESVYQLKGGILKYLETVPKQESLWEGECFVFDQRVAVQHGLSVGTYDMCYGCRAPLSSADRASAHYEEGVSCSHCYHRLTEKSRSRARARQKQVRLARARERAHVGAEMPAKK